MSMQLRYLVSLSLAACLLLPGAILAQEEGGEAPPPGGALPKAAPIVIDNPTVRLILESQPTTPSELARTIGQLVDLRAAAAARPLLLDLMAVQLDEAGLASLGEEFGTAMFLKFSLQDELNPEARQLAQSVVTAVHNRASDPARITALIANLQDPSAAVRSKATIALRAGGAVSAAALVEALADGGRAAEQAAIRTALVGQGEGALGPLTAALLSPDPALVAQVIGVLGRMESSAAAPYLLGPAVSPDSPPPVRAAAAAALERIIGYVPDQTKAASLLYKDARSYYDRKRPLNPDPDDKVVHWSWDATGGRPVAHSVLSADASGQLAARLSADLHRLMPSSRLVSRLYLGSLLETASYETGLDNPLPQGPGTAYQAAADGGIPMLLDLLEDALLEWRPRVATPAARILGNIGSVDLLDARSPAPSLLVQAALASDRRLSFTALEAIQKLAPARPYPGSSLVLEKIAFFAGSSGAPRVLVAETQRIDAQRFIGLLLEIGYEADVVVFGDQFLEAANVSPDYELALVDLDLPRWPVSQVLQQLRRDGRGGGLPVGVLVPPGGQRRGEPLREQDALVETLVRPTDRAGMESQLGRVLARLGRDQLPHAERQRQAAAALSWLASLAAEPEPVYDTSRAESAALTALTVPALAGPAAAFLAQVGTPRAQRALVDLASQPYSPLALREQAAADFQASVGRYGTLLTTTEILAQYDRYNASEGAEKPVQDLLGSILDTIEAATDDLGGLNPQPLSGENAASQ